jgi:hypothetical protein
MAEDGKVVHELEPHAESYGVFVKLTVATVLSTLFILVGLLAIGFAKTASVLVGTGTIVIGLVAVTLTLMTGGRNWLPVAVLFIVSFLLTASLL